MRKLLCAVITSVLAVGVLAGCGGKTSQEDTKSYGYQKYDISKIDDLQTVQCLKRSAGDLILLGENTDGEFCKYTSSDDGVSWMESQLEVDVPSGTAAAATVDTDGKAIIGCTEIDNLGNITSCFILRESDGSRATVDASNIGKIEYCSDDFLYIYDGTTVGKYTWEDGKLSNTYTADASDCLDFTVLGDELLVLTEKELIHYDSTTGKKNDTDSGISNALADELKATAASPGKDALSCHRMLHTLSDGKLILILEDGIYQYDSDSQLVTKLIGSDAEEWKTDGTIFYDFVVAGAEDALSITTICSGTDTKQVIGYSATEMAVSAESEQETVQKQTTITVWSLKEEDSGDNDIKKTFEKEYPYVIVNWEYGIPYESGITTSDAIKTLNTQLLAGDGPDVIIMDGLDVQRYVNAGQLLDLTDIYDEILEENPNCIKNVISAYKSENGVYAIPSRVQCVAVIASENDIDRLTDIASISAYIRDQKKLIERNALGLYGWNQVFETLYPVYSSDIISTDGVYSAENLRTFFSNIKELNDILLSQSSETEIAKEENQLIERFGKDNIPTFAYSLWESTGGLYFREESGQQLALNYIMELNGLAELYSLKHYKLDNMLCSNDDLKRKILKNQSGVPFVAAFIGAVNKASKCTEEAKLFVKMLVGDEIQAVYTSKGIEVNMDGLKDLTMESTEEWMEQSGMIRDHLLEKEPIYLLSQNLDEVKTELEALDTLSNSNAEIKEMIKSGMQAYCEGEKTLDEAVEDTGKSLKLYLSE